MTRLKAYLALSFLLGLFLFHVGVQHNPQGAFIDLDTNELDLGYSALFMSTNMAVVLAFALAFELCLRFFIFLGRRLISGAAATPTNNGRPVVCLQADKDRWRKRLTTMIGCAVVPSLLIGGVATYAAYRHNPQEMYFSYETHDVALWACAKFFWRCFAAFSFGLGIGQLGFLQVVLLLARLGDRLRARSKIF